MKKALAYTLSLALLLSLTACHKPQTEQPDTSQPDNSAATSSQVPEADNTPEQLPATPAPAQLSDTTQAAPTENEDPPAPEDAVAPEPTAQEPAEPEPVSEPVQTEAPKQTAPKADNPPAETTETTPAEPAQEQQPPAEQQQAQQQTQEQPDLSGFTFAKPKENKGTTGQQMPSAEEIRRHLQETDPNYRVLENGDTFQSAAEGNERIGLN